MTPTCFYCKRVATPANPSCCIQAAIHHTLLHRMLARGISFRPSFPIPNIEAKLLKS